MTGAGGDREQGNAWREKEEPDTVVLIPSADVRQNGKRRIVDDDAPVRVFVLLIVSAGEERPGDLRSAEIIVLQHPGLHGLEDVGGRVAVVGCLLRLLRLQPLLVLFTVHAFGLPIVVGLEGVVCGFRVAESDSGSLKAYQGDVEAGGPEGLCLGAEDVFVVAGLAQEVVRMDEGPPLVLGQILDRDGRHLGPAFRLGGQQPAVSVDDAVLVVDADGDDHAKLTEGTAELFDLLRGMEFGVVFVGMKLGDLPQLHAGDCSHVFLLA